MGGACACCTNNKTKDPQYTIFPPLQYNRRHTIYGREYPLSILEPNRNSLETMRQFKIVLFGESFVGKTSIISQKMSETFDLDSEPTIEDYYVKIHRINLNMNVTNNYNIEEDTIAQILEAEEDERKDRLTTFSSSPTAIPSISLSSPSISKKHFSQAKRSTSNLKNRITINTMMDKYSQNIYHCVLDIQDTAGSLNFRSNLNQWIWRSSIFVIVFDLCAYSTFENLECGFIKNILRVRECRDVPMVLVGNKSDLMEIPTFLKNENSAVLDVISSGEKMGGINDEITIHQSLLTHVKTYSTSSQMTDYSNGTVIEHVNHLLPVQSEISCFVRERKVSEIEIEQLCNKYNMPYIQVSAKEYLNLEHIWNIAVKERLFHEQFHSSTQFLLKKQSTIY